MQTQRQALVGLQLAMISPNPGTNLGSHLKDILQKEVPLQPAHFPIKYQEASSESEPGSPLWLGFNLHSSREKADLGRSHHIQCKAGTC